MKTLLCVHASIPPFGTAIEDINTFPAIILNDVIIVVISLAAYGGSRWHHECYVHHVLIVVISNAAYGGSRRHHERHVRHFQIVVISNAVDGGSRLHHERHVSHIKIVVISNAVDGGSRRHHEHYRRCLGTPYERYVRHDGGGRTGAGEERRQRSTAGIFTETKIVKLGNTI